MRRSDGSVLLEINLDGIPLGCQHFVDEAPRLGDLIELMRGLVAESTTSTEWMQSWHATQLVIIAGHQGDKVLLRTQRSG